MSKNLCNKTRNINDPYEIWINEKSGWEWRVLRKYQNLENEIKNKYARWFCGVRSPMTYDTFELGDTYVKDIKLYSIKMTDEEMKTHLERKNG